MDVAAVLGELSPGIHITLAGGDFPIQSATPYASPRTVEKDVGFTLQYPLDAAIRDFIREAEAAE